MRLDPSFLRLPLAHRALHGPGAPENSRAAVRAAVAAGYGIEIDLQLSADGAAMVFHDYGLERLCGVPGTVRTTSAAALAATPLLGSDEGVPTLNEVLSTVAGEVPLLIELKDQDGAMGPDIGALEAAMAAALAGYDGPVAVMSFNPHSVARMAALAPHLPRGLTTSSYRVEDWPMGAARCDELRGIPDYAAVGACFISHEAADLDRPRVAELKAAGADVLCWTIRNADQEAAARRVADNITFEGYAPAIPG
ncbi:MAG: glycerophosphodiester phosphodiesterase family protein [Pseudomonadota bacterium]